MMLTVLGVDGSLKGRRDVAAGGGLGGRSHGVDFPHRGMGDSQGGDGDGLDGDHVGYSVWS